MINVSRMMIRVSMHYIMQFFGVLLSKESLIFFYLSSGK